MMVEAWRKKNSYKHYIPSMEESEPSLLSMSVHSGGIIEKSDVCGLLVTIPWH